MQYRFGGCVLDVGRHELRRDGQLVHVEPQVFEVLRYLVQNAERVVPREELLDEIWGSRFVTESALTSRIKAARRAVGDDGAAQAVIRTVRGAGLRLVAAVSLLDEPPPTPSAGAGSSARGIPHPRTAVIGREADVAAVGAALERSRLVTVVGPGGVGKTTTAMVAATEASHRFGDGAFWCDWSTVEDERGAADAMADVLGVTRQPELDCRRSLVVGIGRRAVLLVADNCEHVLDEASELIDELVAACPSLTVLATSRSPLAIPGEVVHRLHPLPCDSGDAWSTAARLFLERARAANSDLELDERHRSLIEALCARVDGLPLALELTAARLRTSSLQEVVDGQAITDVGTTRQRARTRRHRTMKDTIAWSHQLLPANERRLFEQLWVFAGEFELDDAAGLVEQLGEAPEAVDELVAGLVDHSMVVADLRGSRARFRMLETLRSYAHEVAPVAVRRRVRAAHTAWAALEAERLHESSRGPDEQESVRRFDERYAEFRSAHSHAVDGHDVDTALRLTVALHYLAVHRLRDEVFSWASAALELPGADQHELYPTALGCLAQGLANRGELTRARYLAERALERCDEMDPAALWALRTLSNVSLYEGRLTEAREFADREAAIVALVGDDTHAAYAEVTHVLALAYAGDLEGARTVAARQAEWADRAGNPTQQAWARFCEAEARADDPERALTLLESALALGRSVQSEFAVGVISVAMGATHVRVGRYADALTTLDGAIAHWYRRGDWTHQWTTLRNVVHLLVELGRHTEATRLLGAVTDPRSGARPYGADVQALARDEDRLRGVLGPVRFERLVAEGRSLERDEVIGVARSAIAAAADHPNPAAP